jgi:hypothetical protein
MARRDLSRTVIEGGRYRHNKFERRSSHGINRACARAWIDEVRVDVDLDDARVGPAFHRVRREFYDKLAVPVRWLRSRCGRRWDDVFSELMARFDPRTVAGRHIVFDHMLTDIRRSGELDRGHSFEIDADGILRALPSWRDPRKRPRAPRWTRGWSAARIDRRWWWVGDRPLERCVHRAACRFLHLEEPDGTARHFTPGTRIQPMTSTEVGRLTSLPRLVREVVLWRGPVLDPVDAVLARPPASG